MPEPSQSDSASSAGDSWPWACLDCGGTIYHDGRFCRDCERARALDRVAALSTPGPRFSHWIREQSYPSFVTSVTAVASLEVSLTAIWLQFLLAGPAWLGPLGF